MKQLSICLALGLLAGFVSCKKKDPPAQEINTPEFSSTFNAGSEKIVLEAGNNNYYMFASCSYDSLIGINVYRADLKTKNCTGICPGSLSVLINDISVSAPGAAMKVDSALFQGRHLYNDLSTDPQYYKAVFVPEKPFTSSSTYSWTLTEGQNKTTFTTYSFTAQLDVRKKYEISLKFDDGVGGCTSTHTNEFRVGHSVQTEINVKRESPLTDLIYSFSSSSSGMAPFKYEWDFGDNSSVSTEEKPTHTYAINNVPYRARLQIIDACGDTCISYYQVPSSLENPCHANFKANFKPVYNPLVKGTVTILYTDASGQTYTTRNFLQPADSRFDIVAPVEEYRLLNSKNERTKKVKATFNCLLKNGNKAINITNGSAVFAVSYK